jgi:hypothetical protein
MSEEESSKIERQAINKLPMDCKLMLLQDVLRSILDETANDHDECPECACYTATDVSNAIILQWFREQIGPTSSTQTLNE